MGIHSSQMNVQVCQTFNQNSNRVYLGVRGAQRVGRELAKMNVKFVQKEKRAGREKKSLKVTS